MEHPAELENCLRACERHGVAPTAFLFVINIATQTALLFEKDAGTWRRRETMSCSTSRFGIGQQAGSNCTPLGLHCIAEKIGAGEPAGAVFKARKVIGHTSQPEFAGAKITTRILWLEGLEPEFNRGGDVDTHARYVYIHGTADQQSVGAPASHGCIHLADAELIPLFDLLPGGTLVWVCEK
ncbi:MAG: L,D-transpeptidase [Verrucomicrobiota bacterium]